jgi:CRP-like cAMP-binding protein
MTKATRRTRFSRDAKVKRLAGVPLFSACSKTDLTKIAALADELEVPEGKVLMTQGDRAHECFVILAGKAKVSIRGKRSTTLGAGDCVGELALLDPGARRSATVTAQTDLDLLVLGAREFSSFLDEVPRVGRQVLSAAAERLRAAEGPRPHH